MDDKTFDALIRGAGSMKSRRAAITGLVGGALAVGLGRQAAGAQVSAESCKIKRCKKQVLLQTCTDSRGNPDNHKCCQGLKCSNRRGVCVFQNGHGEAGDYCRTNNDCDQSNYCKKNQCIPDQCR